MVIKVLEKSIIPKTSPKMVGVVAHSRNKIAGPQSGINKIAAPNIVAKTLCQLDASIL